MKEEIIILSQLIEAMDDALIKLENSMSKNNKTGYEQAKKEILEFQIQISKVVGK